MMTTIEESTVRTHRIPENRPPTHPGAILLKDFREPLGMSQRELAERLGVHYPRVNELVNGKRSVTTETALMLAKLFGTTPQLWLNLQNTRDLYETLHDADSSERLDDVEPLERPDSRMRGGRGLPAPDVRFGPGGRWCSNDLPVRPCEPVKIPSASG